MSGNEAQADLLVHSGVITKAHCEAVFLFRNNHSFVALTPPGPMSS